MRVKRMPFECRGRPSASIACSRTTSAAAWIYAGGPHHTVFSQAVNSEHIEDFAEMVGVECLRIDGQTRISAIKNELRWNEAYYGGGRGRS